MTTYDYRALCVELLMALENAISIIYCEDGTKHISTAKPIVNRARAALAQPEPGAKRRYIYNPVQIAECGGPCEQGPDHCDCGELWITEPELENHQ